MQWAWALLRWTFPVNLELIEGSVAPDQHIRDNLLRKAEGGDATAQAAIGLAYVLGHHIRASKQLLQAGADAYVRSLIGKGTLISAKRRGVVVQGGTAVVGYEFTFRTKAGLVRTNPNGHLYFYLDEAKGWINSDVVIDGLPRY